MARYLSFDRRPGPIAAPSLLLRAADPLGDGASLAGLSPWDLMDAAVDVPGDHFTVMEDRADHTARVLGDWLRGEVEGREHATGTVTS
ncbi:hypothetical protein OG948_01950 [Embleya sp. NBC_00888]|uniref:hypothetical protein n=1 Tax=Embleya sp. NBC_00888 TaxID=2975960 RepID=UPI00386D5ED2|nr:hypothetical protein OG948_01950 [Embleya sp. NBC_00888]